jgi:small ligand-binding sensory domain FIST
MRSMMEAFAYGHASAPEWRDAARLCLEQLGARAGRGNLGFVYATDFFASHMGEIVDLLRAQTGITHWVGSVGMGICAASREYLDEPAIAVMTARFPENSFSILSSVIDPKMLPPSRLRCGEGAAHFAVVHGDPQNAAIAELVAALAERVESGFIVGGLTSSREAAVQVADQPTEGGLSGALFSSKVTVATRLTQGCSPIGPKHMITLCHRNLVIELDGRPALEVLEEDIGEVLARDLSRVSGYIFVGLPIPGSDTGDYLVRNLVGIDSNHKLLAIGEMVAPDTAFMFCRRDGTSAREDMLRMLTSIKSGLQAPPKGGVYYSCLGRGQSLFGPDSAELKLIERELGDFPLVGFFCNGEICHDRLYGYTGVLTLFI